MSINAGGPVDPNMIMMQVESAKDEGWSASNQAHEAMDAFLAGQHQMVMGILGGLLQGVMGVLGKGGAKGGGGMKGGGGGKGG